MMGMRMSKKEKDLKIATILSAFAVLLFLGLLIFSYLAYPSGKFSATILLLWFILCFIRYFFAYRKEKKKS